MAKASKKVSQPEPLEEVGTALIVLETLKPQEVFVKDGSKKLLKIVEEEVAKFKADVTTEEGRKAISRMNLKIAASKNGVEKMKLEYTAELRQQVSDINEEGKAFFTRMEELQEEVSAPLDKWKADEKARVEGHKARLQEMANLALQVTMEHTVQDLKDRIVKANELHDESYDWQDFSELAQEEYDRTMEKLEDMIPLAQKRDDADAAAKLLKDAEDAAAKKVQDDLDRAAAATRQAETDRKNRLKAALDALSDLGRFPETATSGQLASRIEEINRYHTNFGDWQEETDKAENIRKAIVQEITTAKDLKIVSEKEAEEKRIADAAQKVKDAENAAEAERAKDKAHKAAIGKAAIDALVTHAKISQEDARAAMVAIHEGKIPNVKILY